MASPRRHALFASVALGVVAVLGLAVQPAAAAPVDLIGTFTMTPGACSGGVTGSYFRMILPSGNQSGPFIDNSDSTCNDKTYTLFVPGTDGGLVSGGYQPAPDPGFNAAGDSLAARIIQPVKFFGRNFSLSTNPTDLQVGTAVPTPVLRAEGGKLTGDLTAFDATWNNQKFNQGAPKPGGGLPGNTKVVDGTYDAATGRYTLTWSSQIVGGPFDNFTGQWHLEGTFRAAGSGGAAPTVAGTTGGAAPASATTTGGAPTAVAPAAGTGDTGTTVAAAAPGAPASGTDLEQAAVVTKVTDDGFQAPTGLVIVIALLGIAAVIVLVVFRPTEGAPTS